MNTLDLVKEILEADDTPYRTVIGDGWIAYEVEYDTQALRIWSDDTELEIKIAFSDQRGYLGEAVTIESTQRSLVARILNSMIAELKQRVDGE